MSAAVDVATLDSPPAAVRLGSSPLAPRLVERRAQTGYPAGLPGLSAGAPHTIRDLEGYLRDNLGAEALQRIRQGDQPVYLAVGEGSAVRRQLADEGWQLLPALEKSAGFHQLSPATTPDGRAALVVWRVNGEDRVGHLQSLLQMAGLPGERLTTIGSSHSFKADYLRTFTRLPKPDLVVYGMAKTAAATILKEHPIRNLLRLKDLFQRRGAPPITDAAAQRDVDPLRMEVMQLKNGQSIWFIPPLYGDLSRDLADALIERGVDRIHFLGTAGGVNPHYHVGDVVSPSSEVDPQGNRRDLGWLVAAPADHHDATYLRVSTPNLESEGWAHQAQHAGIDVTEVELGYWLEACRQHPQVKLSVQTVLSDILLGDHSRDLTRWSWRDAGAAQDDISQFFHEALGSDLRVRALDSIPLATPI